MSAFGAPSIPLPVNEPVRAYAPSSAERASLEAELDRQLATQVEVPLVIGGEALRTGTTQDMVMPHDHGHVTGTCHQAGEAEVAKALAAAEAARPAWAGLPWEERAAVFLRAAKLLEGEFRDRINAATMLGQSKTCHQAEIDAACELIDFFRFNVHFLERIYAEQPGSPNTGEWNRLEYRPLDGFVFAVTPFNFTSIAANLCAAPAMCGNTVIWKPGPTALLSGHVIMELFAAAGMPPGVINFVPGPAAEVGAQIMADPRLAGLHFTGSTATFKLLWKQVADNLDRYRAYPRVVGETGGKDFVFAHPSADPERLAVALLRGAFEFQGQKCSAASRAYIPASLWPQLRERLAEGMKAMKVGDVRDFSNFMGAVIDARAYQKHAQAIAEAKGHADVEEVLGGKCDDNKGYFVEPTVIVAKRPDYRTMTEELFGPILTLYVYPDAAFEQTLKICDESAIYGLTGAIFADDRHAVATAVEALRFTAGNFYVNDKPTGAVVGQQPFGGSRASGTNDKAGSIWNLIRWLSPRTIKENLAAPKDWRYPFMA
ncbi:L-glutamate gamma-semialdehyde dehydrogenase [Pseudenhygromyxa sp. WMMC2535]|uniref:L-glutamate gamma-semialdehyde dehydrogenase n=1 Tax=Pseudenhygromyxa sp. WMMC2535 TaxID=2712867 RepID=UPI001557CC3A|nr:L-glutamate gamma-semialdehyde dehydrogenase [Pseudenhygromyxa sp. WMMC2535]NVB39030.1 L-glutamate gamma-semialdehyde dehydrogenase [Pseudenhygromyxa sp. WMMC2535]